jgi:hypothetical protein
MILIRSLVGSVAPSNDKDKLYTEFDRMLRGAMTTIFLEIKYEEGSSFTASFIKFCDKPKLAQSINLNYETSLNI